jgi:hypothetical protein
MNGKPKVVQVHDGIQNKSLEWSIQQKGTVLDASKADDLKPQTFIRMFEREIQRAKENLARQLHIHERYVYWRDIHAVTHLHPCYKQFFGAEVRWWVHEQQVLRVGEPRFDFASPAMAQALQQIDTLYLDNARFDPNDLAATIDLAAKTRFNYLLRPRTTLRWFVFRGEPTKPLGEVLLRLQYFYEYAYLMQGFQAWVEQQQRASDRASVTVATQELRQELVSVVEFERVIAQIDNDQILDLSPVQFVELLEPIFELFAEVGSANIPQDTVPNAALVIFLDDKGIVPIAREIEMLLVEEQRVSMSRKEFLHLLDTVLSKVEHEMPTQQPIVQQQPQPAITAEQEHQRQALLLENLSEPMIPSTLQAKLAESKLAAKISAELREQLVHTVFHHSESELSLGVQRLEQASSLKEAMAIIDGFARWAELDPHSQIFYRLRDMVYQHFAEP